MLENADFHIHSPFSIATSRAMSPSALIGACTQKGITVLGCGDALHAQWRAMWEPYLENDAGIVIVPTVEVEGAGRVHHLILLEDFDRCEELARRFRPYSKNIATGGRPFVALRGEEIAMCVHDLDGLIGPSHAFTPWTGLYGRFESLKECYGAGMVDFLELGLSADSGYGAGISELAGIPFLSNSDAHSPTPLKVGREFNRITVRRRTASGVLESVRQADIVMNAGFFPEQGKYNRTACTRCFHQYTRQEAEDLRWICPLDGGRIKQGVRDRADVLTDSDPGKRPPYFHILPLGEIIQRCLGTTSPNTKKCRRLYDLLLTSLGTEIEILADVPVAAIRNVHPSVADAVAAFRAGAVTLIPGGGGRYGSFTFGQDICGSR
jgi:uncharacterized protein (TIGR00375 family)